MDKFLAKLEQHQLRKDQIIQEEEEEDTLSPLAPPSTYMRTKGERLPFNDYRPTYVEDVQKILYDVRSQITNLLSQDVFVEITKKNSKLGPRIARLLDDVRSHQYEIDRTIDVVEMEKKLVDHELTLFRKYLSDREEMILNSLYREQTLERQLQQLRKEMSLLGSNMGSSPKNPIKEDERNKVRKSRYGEILQDHILDEWLGTMSKFKDLESSRELLSNQSQYMQNAINEKMNDLENTRSEYDTKLQAKDELLRDLKKKLSKKSSNYTKRETKEFEEKIRLLEKEISSIEKEKNARLLKVNENITSLQTKYDAVVSELLEKERLLKKFEDIKNQEDESFPKSPVTLVFTDIQSSSALWEKSIEGMVKALRIHNECVREIIPKYKGYEVKTEGDAFMIAFHSSFDAVNFAMTTQVELMKCEWPEFVYDTSFGKQAYDRKGKTIWKGLRIRMGIHVGSDKTGLFHQMDPVTRRCDYFGPPVNRAARVESVSCGGEVCVSNEVWQEIKSIFKKLDVECVVYELGEFKLKGMEENAELIRSVFPKELVGRRASLEKRKVLPFKNEEEQEGEGEAGEGEGGESKKDGEEKNEGNNGLKATDSQDSVRSDGEIPKEKKELLNRHTDIFYKLIQERIKMQRRQVIETLMKLEDYVKNPGKVSSNPDLIRREKRSLQFALKSMSENMKNFKSFVVSGEPLNDEEVNQLFDEYKIIRKKNTAVKRRKESVKARYLDHLTNPREAVSKRKHGLRTIGSGGRNRRKTWAEGGGDMMEGEIPGVSQTAIPGRAVRDNIFDQMSRPKSSEEMSRMSNSQYEQEQQGMVRSQTMDFEAMGRRKRKQQNHLGSNLKQKGFGSMENLSGTTTTEKAQLSGKEILMKLPDIRSSPGNRSSFSPSNSSKSVSSSNSKKKKGSFPKHKRSSSTTPQDKKRKKSSSSSRGSSRGSTNTSSSTFSSLRDTRSFDKMDRGGIKQRSRMKGSASTTVVRKGLKNSRSVEFN